MEKYKLGQGREPNSENTLTVLNMHLQKIINI